MARKLGGWVLGSMLFCGLGLYGCGSSSGSNLSPLDGDQESISETEEIILEDGDSEAESEAAEEELAEGQIIMVPVLALTSNAPEPLTWVNLDATGAYLPRCTSGICDAASKDAARTAKATNIEYSFTLAAKPAYADEIPLLAGDATESTEVDIRGKWVKSPLVKFFAPISGIYVVSVTARATRPSDDDPKATCPACPENTTQSVLVKPSENLFVELLWDKGGQTDMDLFLVRYRDDGSFGYSAGSTIVQTPEPIMPSCESSADCFGGALECGAAKTCTNACTGDAVCHAANPGWICKNNVCQVNNDTPSSCKSDSDCGEGNYCNPIKKSGEWVLACTNKPKDIINDTLFYNNRWPFWSPYNGGTVACTTHEQCQAIDPNSFCGFDTTKPGYCASTVSEANPVLDIDDVTGWGPETISIKNPAPGRYRIVARLWADGTGIVSDRTPSTALTASIHVTIGGQPAFGAIGISHDFTQPMTYWKVADVIWEGKDSPNNKVVPICAGWTRNTCETTTDCQDALGTGYTCETRDWNKQKFCSTCAEGGNPQDCSPSKACTTDVDCVDEQNGATHCAAITQKYCTCAGAGEFAQFKSNPYANPVSLGMDETLMNPLATPGLSIWCDSPSTEINAQNHKTCSTLYGN